MRLCRCRANSLIYKNAEAHSGLHVSGIERALVIED